MLLGYRAVACVLCTGHKAMCHAVLHDHCVPCTTTVCLCHAVLHDHCVPVSCCLARPLCDAKPRPSVLSSQDRWCTPCIPPGGPASLCECSRPACLHCALASLPACNARLLPCRPPTHARARTSVRPQVWKNLGLSRPQRKASALVQWALFWLMTAFYFIPVGALQVRVGLGARVWMCGSGCGNGCAEAWVDGLLI